MRRDTPYPWIGPRASDFKIRRSKVPCRRSISFGIPPPPRQSTRTITDPLSDVKGKKSRRDQENSRVQQVSMRPRPARYNLRLNRKLLNAAYWTVPSLFCLLLYWPGLRAWFQADDFVWLNLPNQAH